MRVRYLDLQTGKTEWESGVTVWQLTEGDWNCDCNRATPFFGLSESNTCDGCRRFIAIDLEPQEADGAFDSAEVLREANKGYYQRLSRQNDDYRLVTDG